MGFKTPWTFTEQARQAPEIVDLTFQSRIAGGRWPVACDPTRARRSPSPVWSVGAKSLWSPPRTSSQCQCRLARFKRFAECGGNMTQGIHRRRRSKAGMSQKAHSRGNVGPSSLRLPYVPSHLQLGSKPMYAVKPCSMPPWTMSTCRRSAKGRRTVIAAGSSYA